MVRPRKSLGQHFLRSAAVLGRIVEAAAPAEGRSILEIGAGDGALTAPLARLYGRVFALETDRRLAEALRGRFAPGGAVEVVEADALRWDLELLRPAAPLACVSNLPYNVATAILERLLAARGLFVLHVLMFQKEVARRLTARPGTGSYGSLTLATAYRAEAELLFTVPRGAFAPPPQVESAVVRLRPRPGALLDPSSERTFERLVRGGFSHRRKMFVNALARSGSPWPEGAVLEALAEIGCSPRARAEEIDLEGYLTLARRLTVGPSRPAPGN